MTDTQSPFSFAAALLQCGSPGQTFSMESLLKPELGEYSPSGENGIDGEESTIWYVNDHMIPIYFCLFFTVLYVVMRHPEDITVLSPASDAKDFSDVLYELEKTMCVVTVKSAELIKVSFCVICVQGSYPSCFQLDEMCVDRADSKNA